MVQDKDTMPKNQKRWLSRKAGRSDWYQQKIYDDPKHVGARTIGWLAITGGVSTLHRFVAKDEHYFNNFDGYAVQESWFESMKKCKVDFIYIYEFDNGVQTTYRCPHSSWMEYGVTFDEGHGVQRGVPLSRMEFIESKKVTLTKTQKQAVDAAKGLNEIRSRFS